MEGLVRLSMTVFGVQDGHDARGTLVRYGEVLTALYEERPRDIKLYSGTH